MSTRKLRTTDVEDEDPLEAEAVVSPKEETVKEESSGEKEFEPVWCWNPVHPGLRIAAEGTSVPVTFVEGRFLITNQYQADLIASSVPDEVFFSDSKQPIVCKICGWETESVAAFNYHAAQH